MAVWVRAAASAAAAATAELLTAVAIIVFFFFFFRRMGTGSRNFIGSTAFPSERSGTVVLQKKNSATSVRSACTCTSEDNTRKT